MNTPRPNFIVHLIGLATIALLVGLCLEYAPGASLLSGKVTYLELFRARFAEQPVIAVALFCVAHLLCSLLGVPGGCTALNLTAGATFGFWLGCAIVYPITLLSAVLMYAFARWLRSIPRFADRPRLRRWRARYEANSGALQDGEYWFLVGLRLSPLLPFGILNFLMGWCRLSFVDYLVTTIVGIFFDVTLLNNLGALLSAPQRQSTPLALVLSFGGLLVFFFVLRLRVPKSQRESTP